MIMVWVCDRVCESVLTGWSLVGLLILAAFIYLHSGLGIIFGIGVSYVGQICGFATLALIYRNKLF